MTATNIFLRNSNLLEEIEKSKLSFCCYKKPEDALYDVEFQSYELISPAIIDSFFIEYPEKNKIIMRIMTDEHIINAPVKYKMDRSCASSMLPFKHFVLLRSDFFNLKNIIFLDNESIEMLETKIENNKNELKEIKLKLRDASTAEKMNKDIDVNKDELKLIQSTLENENIILKQKIIMETDLFNISLRPYLKEVLRSHWVGESIETGHLSYIHGQLTDNLARMLMLMASKYIKAGNWSGYSYIDDMESAGVALLIERVLKFDAGVSNNPFSYLTSCISNVYIAILNKEKEQRMIKSSQLQDLGYSATFGELENESFSNGNFGEF